MILNTEMMQDLLWPILGLADDLDASTINEGMSIIGSSIDELSDDTPTSDLRKELEFIAAVAIRMIADFCLDKE